MLRITSVSGGQKDTKDGDSGSVELEGGKFMKGEQSTFSYTC